MYICSKHDMVGTALLTVLLGRCLIESAGAGEKG
jgi:hypothetical protein